MLGRRYRLLSQVGRGGMGRVWRAHDELLHRDVAVKEVIFPPGLTTSEREVLYERTLREARSAARLSHRGIVTVHDVVEEDGRPWIVMEYVRARSLQAVIDQYGRLSPAEVAEIGVQVLAALRVAHDAGVLHRDVKPANVLLDTASSPQTPRVVITDFGIAQMAGDATLTQTGLVLGSPAYISPERARGDKAGVASDLWALGATLYAACEGRAPHDREDAMAALTAVLTEEAAPPRHAGPLAPVLMGLLAKDPAYRITAAQAAEDLARAARGNTSPAAPDPAATMYDVPDDMTMLDPVTDVGRPRPPDRPPGPSGVAGPVTGDGRPAAHTGPVPPRRGRWRTPLLLTAGLVVLVVVISAVTFLVHRSAHSAARRPPATASPRVSPTPIPPGFARADGAEGSTLAVPDGWTKQVLPGGSVKWTEPGTGAYVQVDSIPWDVADPVEHWRRLEREVTAKNRLPGYRRLRLGRAFTFRGWRGADLEYTWNSTSHGRLRGYDRGFTANRHQYAILVAAPAARWSHYAAFVDTAFDWFAPAA